MLIRAQFILSKPPIEKETMSLYFTLLFVLLTLEMSTIFLLVLPLPFRLRRSTCALYDKLAANQQVRTAGVILAVLVSLLFADSWKRANVHVSLYHHQNSDAPGSASMITPTQALASRSYNQRNVYISGFILYFMVCIVTIMSIVKKLVKYETLIREQKLGHNSKENEEQQKEFRAKELSLEALQKQVANFEKHFDELNKPENAENIGNKKNE